MTTSNLTSISSLVTLLFSLSTLRDWLKLLVVGGFLEACRRFISSLFQTVKESLFITATFDDEDDSFRWIMHWLSQHPSWSRTLKVSTRSLSLPGMATLVPGEEQDPDALTAGKRNLSYVPATTNSLSFWYKRHWINVTRFERELQNNYFRTREESLQIRILTRSHQVLNELLLEAKRAYTAAQNNIITIYVSDSSNCWKQIATRPKRPLDSIILDPGMKDDLVADAKDFLQSRDWYADRGIPFRRGYLLYGAPGSGKTSIIHSIAGELGLDIYVITLSRAGLDDTGLTELITELPERCIALMEDIDAALTQSITREKDTEVENDPLKDPRKPQQPPGQNSSLSRVSLSGLLNALDGVSAQEGRILFATTNKYTSLDPALCRPGRMDVHIEFKLASKYQARELYRTFYVPESMKDMKHKEFNDEKHASQRPEGGAEMVDDLIDISESSTENKPMLNGTHVEMITGMLHQKRTPRLSHNKLSMLADSFADAIPEREISMAALQGFLMVHKVRPIEAVKNVPAWIAKETKDKPKGSSAPETASGS
ncbi:hypothetical protein AMATHDRAFT_48054 [Amanita thiersii Skay4041]|uniref:AAA+ ATPase domain-containing protein n=1 Tax=Amanita thiersii Skay4041 TaxID=703135 RepID=A0A2A9NRA3_9AGAR|nr:hypothetical protein AMATHDRAFT_48054 [Amanita thiersii Skay4041]